MIFQVPIDRENDSIYNPVVKTLEKFRIMPAQDAAHVLSVDSSALPPHRFSEKAFQTLDSLSAEVIGEVIPNLENYSGRWHPNGFMVFQLGTNTDLGTLRLHIWPNSFREMSEKANADTIHDHAWHLSSKILAGVYRDELYDVSEVSSQISEEERAQQGLLRVFRVNYDPNLPDSLVTDGTFARPILREHRNVSSGGHHFIEAGVFHKTTIPEDKLVATLVLNSPTIQKTGPRILINGPAEAFSTPRKAISREEVMAAKSQVQSNINL